MSDNICEHCEREECFICEACLVCLEDPDHEKCPHCMNCMQDGNCQEVCIACGVCTEDYDIHTVCPECGMCCHDGNTCGEWGTTTVNPWGNDYSISVGGAWENVWTFLGENHLTVDPVQAAAEFYVLEAISAGVLYPVPGVTAERYGDQADDEFFQLFGVTKKEVKALIIKRNKHLNKRRTEEPEFNLSYLMGTAEKMLEELVETLDRLFIEYLNLAIGGELRYHACLRYEDCGTYQTLGRSSAWVQWNTIYNKYGASALRKAGELFLEFDDNGFGGPGWADGAFVLADRLEGKLGPNEQMNKRMFIDRVWTLEHNNGCMLNKVHWPTHNALGWKEDMLPQLFDFHASNPPHFDRLMDCVSDSVEDLHKEYYNAAIEVLANRGEKIPEKVAS